MAFLTLDPTLLDFGDVTNGTPYTLDCNIYNDGGEMTITSVSTNNTQFVADLATGPLGAFTGTLFHITFTPTGGAATATLTILSNAINNPITASLVGTGVAAGSKLLSINPSAWDYGAQKNGVASTEKIFVLKNNGTASLSISALNYTSPFSAGATQPGLPYALAAGATVSVGVKFTPTGTGYVSKTNGLSVVSDATGSPDNLLLSGTGYPLTSAFILNNSSVLTLAAFGNVVKKFDPSNLSCEEACSTDKLVNFDVPTFEKSLYTVQVDYENLGVATLKVSAVNRRGDSLSQSLSIGTVGANEDVLNALADLQESEEVIHLQLSVLANGGPVSILGYTALIEPAGEVVKK